MEQELDRGRALVLADEHRRVVGVEGERPLVGSLLADPEEAVDRALAVGAVDPAALGAELEPGGGGRLLHRVERGEERGGVDAVAGGGGGCGGGHGGYLLVWFGWSVCRQRRRGSLPVGRDR